MRRAVAAVAIIGLANLVPRVSAAQLGFEQFLSNINDISLYATCWSARGAVQGSRPCGDLDGGFGVRISFSTGSLSQPPRAAPAPAHPCVPPVPGCVPASGPAAPNTFWYITFSLGYGQFTAFESVNDSVTLKGGVREFPSVSLELNRIWRATKRFSPVLYGGLQSGVLQLMNTSAYVPFDSTKLTNYSGSGTAIQLGVLAGARAVLGSRASLFIESQLTTRRFPNVQWQTSGNTVPRVVPRDLQFSGVSFAFGASATLRPPQVAR